MVAESQARPRLDSASQSRRPLSLDQTWIFPGLFQLQIVERFTPKSVMSGDSRKPIDLSPGLVPELLGAVRQLECRGLLHASKWYVTYSCLWPNWSSLIPPSNPKYPLQAM